MFAPASRPRSRRAYPQSQPQSQSQSQSQTQGQGQGQGYGQSQQGHPRPASPRGAQRDFLAEAREAVGRHPITGKVHSAGHSAGVSSHGNDRGNDRGNEEENSVYQETNGERVRVGAQASGTKYDLFVQEMKARKGGRWRAPDGGFYAPERRVEEFYQSGGRG